MKKIIGATGCTSLLAVLLLSSASSVLAQGRDFDGPPPGGPAFGGRPGGGLGGPGRMRGMGGKRNVSRLWRGIGRLEKSSTPLSKAQAKRVVAVVLPLSKRSQMSNAEADKVEAQLIAILTPAQKNTLQKGRGRRGGGDRPGGPGGRDGRGPGGPEGRGDGPDGGRRGGRGGGNVGGVGGPGRPGGGMSGPRMQQMRAFMENFNPFYAPTGYSQWKQLPERMQERMTDRYKDDRAILEALSKKSRS